MRKERDYHKIINKLFLLIGIGLLLHAVFLTLTIDPASLKLLFKIKWYYLLLITLLAMCPWFGHAIRIMMWSRFLDFPVNFKSAFAIVMSNDIGAAITPTAVGGGPVKVGMLVNKGMPAPKATFMALLSATEDLIFYGTGIIFTLLYMHDLIEQFGNYLIRHSSLLYSLALVIIAMIIFKKQISAGIRKIILKLPYNWQEKLNRLNNSLSHYFSDIGYTYLSVIKTGKWRLLASMLILFFQWFSKFTILAIILASLDIPFTWFDMYIKQWIVWMSMLIVPTPGASGGAEAAFLLLFNDNLEGDLTNLIVSTWRFFSYYFILILSVIFFNLLKGQLMKKGQ